MSKPLNIIIFFCFAWFAGKAAWFATSLPPGVAPDEMAHIQAIELHRASPFVNPFNETSFNFARPKEEHSRFGSFTENGSLYHATLATAVTLVSRASVFPFDSIVVLRFVSILFGLLTLYFALGLYKELELPDPVVALALVIHVNLMQFTVSSSALSYDTYSNLFSTAGLFLFVRWMRRDGLHRLLLMAACFCLGTVSKLLVAPVFAAVAVCTTALFFNRSRTSRSGTRSMLMLSFVVFVISAGLFGELFIGNIVEYGTLKPSCDDIFSTANCEQGSSRIYANRVKAAYADAPNVSIIEYAPFWSERMIGRIVGMYVIQGYEYSQSHIHFIQAFLLVLLFIGVLQWKQFRREILMLFGILFFHCAVMLFYNYSGYQKLVPYGINGRYLFPVLSLICLFVSLSALSPFRAGMQWLAMGVFSAFIVFQDMPLALQQDLFWISFEEKEELFYRSLPYQPTPVYDKQLRLIEVPK